MPLLKLPLIIICLVPNEAEPKPPPPFPLLNGVADAHAFIAALTIHGLDLLYFIPALTDVLVTALLAMDASRRTASRRLHERSTNAGRRTARRSLGRSHSLRHRLRTIPRADAERGGPPHANNMFYKLIT